VAGLWTDISLRVLALASMTEVHNEKLDGR
jgi:hypothetical protein